MENQFWVKCPKCGTKNITSSKSYRLCGVCGYKIITKKRKVQE